MTEWVTQARLAMELSEERTRSRREPIILEYPTVTIRELFVRLFGRPVAMRGTTPRHSQRGPQQLTGARL